MGNGVTRRMALKRGGENKQSMKTVKVTGPVEEHLEELSKLDEQPITKRRCKNFKVQHTSQGKKFLHIQKWLGEIRRVEGYNPLMPLSGFEIEIHYPPDETEESDNEEEEMNADETGLRNKSLERNETGDLEERYEQRRRDAAPDGDDYDD